MAHALRRHSTLLPHLLLISWLAISVSVAQADGENSEPDPPQPSTFESSVWRHLAEGRLQWGLLPKSEPQQPQPVSQWSSLLNSWRAVLPVAQPADDAGLAWDPETLSEEEKKELLANLLSRADSPLHAPVPVQPAYVDQETDDPYAPTRRSLLDDGTASGNATDGGGAVGDVSGGDGGGVVVVASLGLTPRGLTAGPSPADLNGTDAFRFASVKARDWVDWRMTNALTNVTEQGQCASSWAVAAADAIASMWAIVTAAPSAPQLDASRLCTCASPGQTACCDGGWTEWALSYALYGKGVTGGDAASGTAATCDAVAADAAKAKITGWERVPAFDVDAMRKAVSQQPIVAFLSASSPDFKGYTGGFYNGGCGTDVDHAVLIVGYGVDPVNGAYWLVKNSWGDAWGEQGFMKLAIRPGAGKCGINQIAPIYPVYYPDSPPATNFPVGPLAASGQAAPEPPYWEAGWKPAANAAPCASPINPCGGGKCAKSRNGFARCTCPAGFVEVVDAPTSICVPTKRCSAGALDPCGAGTCADVKTGGYTCQCDAGYMIGATASGATTCVPIAAGGGASTYTTVWGDTCQKLINVFGLDQFTLMQLNPFLDCTNDLPAGLILAVSDSTADATAGCAASYKVSPGETCSSIATRLKISTAALKTLNPMADCARLYSGQQLCAKAAVITPASSGPVCGLTYVATGRDTCNSVRQTYGLSLALFTSLNPALRCTGPLPVGLTMCVSPMSSAIAVGCTVRHTVQLGDSCVGIAAAANISSTAFLALNPGIRCEPQQLQIGQPVCIDSPALDGINAALPKAVRMLPYVVVENDTLASIAVSFFPRCGTTAGEPAICQANGLVPCDNSALKLGLAIVVPCSPRESNCGCPASIMVCGADYSTYPSYCEALCNSAVPVTPGPCTPCQQACYKRSGLKANPSFQGGCTVDLNSTFCSYPTWPPPDWNLMAESPCAFENTSCDAVCGDTASMLANPVTDAAQWGVFKAQCKGQCMCTPRVPCGGDQCLDS
ncbi:unnamed protein product [Closterium sp. Naga37s-1]|nr:unnamed protein product [Closterium sp. Naga37s-1]